ncbi:hypothetical protein ACFUIT_21455 [Streptomyces sp. NPDC057239]
MTPRIPEWRGTPVPDAVRERVQARTGLDRLELRARRAVHADRAEDLFSG